MGISSAVAVLILSKLLTDEFVLELEVKLKKMFAVIVITRTIVK